MKTKKLIALFLVFAAIFMLCGCSVPNQTKQEAEIPELTDELEPEFSSTDTAEEESENLSYDCDAPEWALAYRDYIANGWEDSEFSLIYLDDDDVPELFVSTPAEASGEFILGYFDNRIIEHHFSRLGSKYIEKSGLVYTSTGHMDYYPLTITKYENGEFKEIAHGLKLGTIGSGNEYTLTYEWEGVEVSEEDFNLHVAEYFDLDKAVNPVGYTRTEIISVLMTGFPTSHWHTYELISQNVTWEEAENICREKGGYLATITSQEEIDKINGLIIEKNMEDYGLFVDCDDDSRTSPPCLLGKRSYSYRLPGCSEDRWDYSEKDYDLIVFDKESESFVLYSVPNDILSAVPEYTDKIGFICEYDR